MDIFSAKIFRRCCKEKKRELRGLRKALLTLEYLLSPLVTTSEHFKSSNICSECNQEYTSVYYEWCKPCNSKHFQIDFYNWTSGNDKIDKLIQVAQLNANGKWEVIEWIPFDRFKDVKQIGKGGFGTIHYAKWIDGVIRTWDIKINNGKDGVDVMWH
ncbi:hypothetical protein Glove_213g79 [Diversispora epigaea]|uniref:Protein kinase domain-containing protein n=1 Tax=Diversispora epigaea TaxID=1348612 RepID=A0A397IMQ4_9GLOM|nr:hypothetical protein Glove_213g79 [Diversispora epigaea]